MNTPQEHEVAKKVVTLLNQGTQQIDASTAARLLQARKQALAHFKKKPAPAWVPAWASATAVRIASPFGQNLRAGFILLVLLTSLAGVVAWQALNQQGSETADIDQALLTDELPINAYLDNRFDSWLKRP